METESINKAHDLEGIKYASTGKRIAAFLIDALVCAALNVIPILGNIASLAYFLTRDALPFEFLDGRSLGKKAVKIRAIEENGKPLTNNWLIAGLRSIILFIPLFLIVELIIMSEDDKNRRLGDKWAKTLVIEDEN